MKTSTTPLYERVINLKRRFRQENRIANGLLDAIPLVNLGLLLLMFFLVNNAAYLQPGIVVKLPEMAATEHLQVSDLLLVIAQDGSIYFDDKVVDLSEVGPSVEKKMAWEKGLRLVVAADERVPYRLLMAVYAAAQKAGIKEVVLSTRTTDGVW